MWPDQYIEWARHAHPLLTRVVQNALQQRYLASNPRLNVDTPELVRDVIRQSFQLASSHRVLHEYFDSSTQFRWWLAGVTFAILRKRLIERPEYAERITSLQHHLLQSFGWVVSDGLEVSDVARQLDVSTDEVDRRVSSAFRYILEESE